MDSGETGDARRTSASTQTQSSATSTNQPSSPSQSTAAPNPQLIEAGKSDFRVNCSYCHGIDANGGFRAPSLVSGLLAHGDSDDAILSNILHGIPGTAMPANDIDEPTAREIIAYLRSLQKNSQPSSVGNPESGRKLFFGAAACSQCHMVQGQGGRFGPDLSRVGAMRPREYLVESIRDPDAQLTERFVAIDFGTNPPTYELVTITTGQGTAFSGVVLNEDSFSLQFMDDREKIHSWLKSELKSVVHEHRSPMPKYDTRQLSTAQLDDLIAYLTSLRGDSK
ncbi:MAG TPA: c-type cytochrome [Candidatus Acidoferrum sp.]|nr:c-type cytochrome [Candidatus Acidoferrum sp.]